MQSRFRALVLSVGVAAAALLATPPAAAQSDDEPLARFEDPICPGIAGFAREGGEAMVFRIRENLAALGLRLAPENVCEPNLIVAAVEDGQRFLERMRRSDRLAFTDMSLREREALMSQPGPARALLRTVPRSRDGHPIAQREDLTSPPQTTMWMAHSKIYTATRNDIYLAMILFDREAVAGASIRQLADYATFRALTQALPETAEARASSILALFDGGADRPDGLTEFDRTYLATLYSGMPNIPGETRLAELEKATGRKVFDH